MCPWCKNPNDESPDTDLLCVWHLAEWDGVTVDQLERRDRDQYAEEIDARGYSDPMADRFADQWQEYRDTFV